MSDDSEEVAKLKKLISDLEWANGMMEYQAKRREEKELARIAEEESKPKGFWLWKHWRCKCKGKRCKPECLCGKPSNRCSCKQWIAPRKQDPLLEVQAPPTPAAIGNRKVWIA